MLMCVIWILSLLDVILLYFILLLRHYSDPHIPALSGIDQYTGAVEHSHRYREPKDYADKTVLVLGASASGLDISLDIAKVAKKVGIWDSESETWLILPTS